MKIFDEKGMTLVELLVTFTLIMIVLPVIYSVFTTGLQLYNKIQVEGQLRDDADYAITMVMNTLYSEPFDYVRSCGDNCIELVHDQDTTFKKTEKKAQTFYQIDKKDREEPITTKISLIEKNIQTAVAINEVPLDVQANFENSTVSLSCQDSKNKCKNGIIKIKFYFEHDRLTKPLELESEFGF